MLKKILITLALVSVLTIPVVVLADSYGLDLAAPQDLKTTKLGASIPEIVGGVIGAGLSLIGIVFFLLILYAGFLWMTALGNATKADKAKEIMEAAGIGLVIVLAAYAITTFLFSKIATGGAGSTSGGATGATGEIGCCTDAFGDTTNVLKINCGVGTWTAGACASKAPTGEGATTQQVKCCIKDFGETTYPLNPQPMSADDCTAKGGTPVTAEDCSSLNVVPGCCMENNACNGLSQTDCVMPGQTWKVGGVTVDCLLAPPNGGTDCGDGMGCYQYQCKIKCEGMYPGGGEGRGECINYYACTGVGTSRHEASLCPSTISSVTCCVHAPD